MLRSTSPMPTMMDQVNVALDEANTKTVRIIPRSSIVGATLGEADLRGQTGATVVAVLHDGGTEINPGADYKLSGGDMVVLLGSNEQIEKAIHILQPDETFGHSTLGGFNP